jgi:hypothetical protein
MLIRKYNAVESKGQVNHNRPEIILVGEWLLLTAIII